MDKIHKVKKVKLKSTGRYGRLLSRDSGTFGIKAGHVRLEPKENIGEHSTAEREEVIFVLKGRGKAIINRKNSLKIEEGSVLYIPPRKIHDIKNTGPGILEYLYVTSEVQN
jgi:mannose-6-phosphate isomerase-like protein (cupin superfamily)